MNKWMSDWLKDWMREGEKKAESGHFANFSRFFFESMRDEKIKETQERARRARS